MYHYRPICNEYFTLDEIRETRHEDKRRHAPEGSAAGADMCEKWKKAVQLS